MAIQTPEPITHDAVIATGVSFVAVLCVVIVATASRRGTFSVIATLILGVTWMLGFAALAGTRLNFLNFIALPITLGIGVDYAVNIVGRLDREPASAHARALGETGSAVVLCSTTTIIGYSSLLVAGPGALRSFGQLADLGEVGCIAAAVLIVPAVRRVLVR